YRHFIKQETQMPPTGNLKIQSWVASKEEIEFPELQRSRGSQHTSYNIPDTKPHSFQKGRGLLKKAKEEKSSLQPVRCFYEPVDCPREIWRAQKKGEPVCSARKLSAKTKMGKKTKQL
ncbi:hypothetical protein CIB84_006559, partial [Bambusicola thoracicus]